MKRFFIAAIALIIGCSTAVAQKKGDMYFGGMTGLAVQTDFDTIGAGFAIQPEFGAFVADNCKVGVSVGYAISGGVHTFTASPNFSYYVRLCEGMYYTPTVEAGFVMAVSGGAVAGLGVGLQMFSLEFRPTKHFGFSASLASINFVALSNAGAALDINIGVNPTVGFKYYF